MHATRRCLAALVATLLAVSGLSSVTAAADGPTILVFSKTAGFRHDSIPAGIAAITDLGDRDTRAVIDSIEGVATLPAVNALRG